MLHFEQIGLPGDKRIACRFWDGECVVYNRYTGDTHLIDEVGAEIFRLATEDKILSRVELLRRITNAFDFPPGFVVEAVVDTLVEDYLKLGLLVVKENCGQ